MPARPSGPLARAARMAIVSAWSSA
jgi:hypothetical protein